ncbi:ThuA domain-containing protein [Mucilaginibacter defluvii]
MKSTFYLRLSGFATLGICIVLFLCGKMAPKPRVLVFAKTAGFHHSSIPKGLAAVMKLGAENSFDVDTTTNANAFIEANLKKYAAVVFLSTTGDVLNQYQEADFERYIQAGGGFVGIHAASDTEYGWGWYGRLVGGYFKSHPAPQQAILNVVDKNHPSTKHLHDTWTRTDEWYNFKKLNPGVKVLINIDEKSYKGGENGNKHPMAWYHNFDGGRAFYTELGHTDESYADPQYLQHVLGGIKYAIGDGNAIDYSKAKTQRTPEANRFIKRVLTEGTLFEPTEMAILPNFDILVAQRRGELMKFDAVKKTVKQVGYLNVYFKTKVPNVNSEEGLLGIAADPNYANNHYIYMYYSPAGDESIDRLSRFVFKGDTLDNGSEKVILEVKTQREICCHTGGSIAFGKDDNLYVSAGDNSTPFDEPGQKYPTHSFGPMDDRPGHEQYDARRSAGNTNDLRGKILRIKVNADGSYDIPEGNLFPKGTAKTRPEIYVMGNRNPYRISIDKKTGYLYWGEVGPDANVDSIGTRGPRGYDEVNQARKAGNFGWPFFVGNNYAYNIHNYNTNENGAPADPAKPINNSRNNTGLNELPPAQPAYIWYPYAQSPEFPELGSGGRTAMTGPVYHSSDYLPTTRYPSYYDGKLIIYDFVRGWIKAVSQTAAGDVDKIEPFVDGMKFNSMIDMEAGPDGRIYVLEYGNGWFNKNPDAAISRIDYLAGNRPPEIASLKVDKTSGSTPLAISATVKATDPEKDALTYVWHIGTIKKTTKVPVLKHIVAKAGEYDISVDVIDSKKASTTSNTITVYAGNVQPTVAVNVSGNRSFYFPGKPINYKVSVKDKDAPVNLANLYVTANMIKGRDMAGANLGHQVVQATTMGKNIMLTLDCKACHKENEASIGPSFVKVAQKYKNSRNANTHLVSKIIKGGAGVWGEVAMPAHPSLKEDDTKLIVGWIRSLADDNKPKSLPANGSVTPSAQNAQKPDMLYTIQANYTDAGANGVRPLSGSGTAALRSSVINADDFTAVNGFTNKETDGTKYLVFPATTGSFKAGKFDGTSIKALEFTGVCNGSAASYTITVYNGKGGVKLGSGSISFTTGSQETVATIPLAKAVSPALRDYYIEVKQSTAVKNPPLLKSIRFVPL